MIQRNIVFEIQGEYLQITCYKSCVITCYWLNVVRTSKLTSGDNAVTKVRNTTHVARACAIPRFSNTCTAKSRRHCGTV